MVVRGDVRVPVHGWTYLSLSSFMHCDTIDQIIDVMHRQVGALFSDISLKHDPDDVVSDIVMWKIAFETLARVRAERERIENEGS